MSNQQSANPVFPLIHLRCVTGAESHTHIHTHSSRPPILLLLLSSANNSCESDILNSRHTHPGYRPTLAMDVFAELSARQQRPAHPTLGTTTRVSPTTKFTLANIAPAPEAAPTTTTAVPTSTRSSQETISSPSSPQRINSASIPSTGSSPTKTSSSSSSYEFPTTFTAFHPSNKPTAPLYRPAALRSADYPAPPQPFLRRNSFSFKESASVKRDHWKVFP
jgi:hypothetical protein